MSVKYIFVTIAYARKRHYLRQHGHGGKLVAEQKESGNCTKSGTELGLEFYLKSASSASV